MDEQVIVREMKKEDKRQVHNILNKIKNFSDEDKKIAIELVEEFIDGTNEDGYYVMCAEKNDKILGYICYGTASLCVGTYDIYYIAVDPDNFRSGVGKLMMKAAEEDIKKKKGRMILLETSSSEDYLNTRNFYHNIGYKEISIIKDYYKNGEDKITYQKRL